MPRFTTSLDIYFDPARGLQDMTVVADQRDLAKWEVQDFRDETRANLRARYVGWCAAVRAGYAGTWAQFNTQDCVSVENTPGTLDTDQGDEQGLDPGRKGRTTGGS